MHTIKGSSSIRGIDMNGNTLTVHFQSGKSYDYEDVPQETMLEMLNADSVGKYFATEIRPHFAGTPATEEETDDGNDQATSGGY